MSEPKNPVYQNRAVSLWLFTVTGFVVLMVLIGGLTRLTDSGLSITEWQPLAGALPPLSANDWVIAFEKYKAIPEFKLINQDFTLAEFKYIYWWEWGHRQLGRVIGLVFFIPFMVFLLSRQIPKGYLAPLTGLFLLGGLQGFIGWYMVQSGLVDRVDVSQYRLAMHLGMALFILSLSLWLALNLWRGTSLTPQSGRSVAFAGFLVGLVFMQSLMGALVAGMDAGKTYTDWPFMDGDLIPAGLLAMEPLSRNFFENYLTVQFDHRIGAYFLLALVLGHAVQQWRQNSPARLSAVMLAVAVAGQGVLGIVALMLAVTIALGAMHQRGAVAVLILSICHLHRLRFIT